VKAVIFKVMTISKTGTVIKQIGPGGTIMSKTVTIPPGIILEVYGFAHSEDTRFLAWNEQFSASFFTVAASDCRPAY
jgi:hypothetical protein